MYGQLKHVVEEILEEANIEVAEQDVSITCLDAEVGPDNKIEIQKAFEVTLVDGLEEKTSMVHFDYGR